MLSKQKYSLKVKIFKCILYALAYDKIEVKMWEVMLCTSAENKRIIQYIYKMMKKLVQDKSCVLTTHKDKQTNYILFACATGKKDYYKEMIKLCIIDYIINVYKYEFLIKKIHNFMKDEVAFKSFIKLLSLYDKQTDEMALKKAINDLTNREKNILDMRYIVGKTQMEIADELGISQAQVSRLEKNAIKTLKKTLK